MSSPEQQGIVDKSIFKVHGQHFVARNPPQHLDIARFWWFSRSLESHSNRRNVCGIFLLGALVLLEGLAAVPAQSSNQNLKRRWSCGEGKLYKCFT